MKKHFLLLCGLFMAATMCFTSCDDDDDDKDGENPPSEVTDPVIIGNNLYAEPILDWTASKKQIKTFMKGYSIYQEDNESLMYTGKYKEALVIYQFSDGVYTSATMAFMPEEVSISTLQSALNNKYDYVTSATEDGISMRIYFHEQSQSMIALAPFTTSGTTINMVLYMEMPSDSNKPGRRDAVLNPDDAFMSRINELIKLSAQNLLP